MKVNKEHEKLFLELVEWSKKKDSYSFDDFLKEKGITEQQLKAMASGKDSYFIALGKATCQCLDNAYKAWKSNEISKDQFSKYLIQSRLFGGGNVESFDRLQQKADLEKINTINNYKVVEKEN